MRVRRMRVRTRVAGLFGALALVASLAGCITVHGEEAVVPATTEEEAQAALERYLERSNEANREYDAEINERIERGPMGAIDNAVLRAQHGLNPGGNPDFEPLEFSDTSFHIPQQAGWPKFFLADTATNRADDARWLLAFTRTSIEEEWFATYLAVLPTGQMPEFAEDADGSLDDLPVGEEYPGLAMAPQELGTAYATYLQEEDGPFAAGTFTTDLLQQRVEENSSPEYQMFYQDEAADPEAEPHMAPIAVRLADGGAMVMFTTRHFDQQTVAEGLTPSVDPLVEELMEGTAETSVTREWVAMSTAIVPEGEGEITIANRLRGVVSAQGE
ncbi:hypothetical protein ACTWP5_06945 [Streptomyces sp. 4N509B]|uniref:hypothetical protein n=1 Tax=Streptomyces sp. 4N509B TaxID=3457413 RepID=UPI003FD4C5E9